MRSLGKKDANNINGENFCKKYYLLAFGARQPAAVGAFAIQAVVQKVEEVPVAVCAARDAATTVIIVVISVFFSTQFPTTDLEIDYVGIIAAFPSL